MNTYENQAQKFLKKTKTMLGIVYKEYGSMPWDTKGVQRDIYEITLSNKNGSYTFDFGTSIADTEAGREPTAYDVLACLDPSFSDYTFTEFCAGFGYDENLMSSLRTYEACVEQSEELEALFTAEELELLQEVQ